VLLSAGAARAQFGGTTGTTGTGGTVGTAALSASDFFIGIQAQQNSNLSDFAVNRFFNKANCDCSTPVFIFYTLLPSGFAKRAATQTASGTVEFWVGTSCDNVLLRNAQCQNLGISTLPTFFQLGHQTLPTDARVVSTYTTVSGTVVGDGGFVTTGTGMFSPTPDCTAPVQMFTQNAYLLISLAGNQTYDVVVTRPINIDLSPPPPPSNVKTAAGNEAVTINWTGVDTSLYPDLFGYQVLCKRGANLQVFSTGTFTPGFLTCPATTMGTGLEGLDEAFVCSPLLSALATSFRVEILQNGITYGVAVVSVDNSKNASTPDVFYDTPQNTKSFYDVYREPPNMGGATGGLCAVAAPARRGWVALLPVAAVATVMIARRRRRRR
jgi:hypothetical protein